MGEKKFRNERKLYINPTDAIELRNRLKILAKPDENAGADGTYKIRSLYFDNFADKAVVEKLSGQSRREKFRFRYYGDDLSFIRLEKKSKLKRLVNKETALIDAEECYTVLKGHQNILKEKENPLLLELYEKMKTQQLRPRTIVDYTREAFIYRPGNVRITIDSNIRMSNHVMDFLNPDSVMIPAANAIILEIKFDNFLPDIMRDAVQLNSRHETEFSKYVVSRLV